MAVIVSCTHCHTRMRIPDQVLGKQVKCPKCNSVFPTAGTPTRHSDPATGLKAKPIVANSSRKGNVRNLESEMRETDIDDQTETILHIRQTQFLRVGLLLNLVASSIYVGSAAIACVILLFAILYQRLNSAVLPLAGFPGMLNWIVALVGLSFCLAGPRSAKAQALGISAVAAAGVHLILLVVGTFQHYDLLYSSFGFYAQHNWFAMATELTYLVNCLNPGQIQRKLHGIQIVTGLVEFGQIVLSLLFLRAIGHAAKQKQATGVARHVLVCLVATVVGLAIINPIVNYFAFSLRLTNPRIAQYIILLSFCITIILILAMLVWYGYAYYVAWKSLVIKQGGSRHRFEQVG